jgi:glucose/arabinose dehydrogenase
MNKSLYLWILVVTLCLSESTTAEIKDSSDPDYLIETVVDGLDFPWSLAFLPNGDMLITELGGSLRLVQDGELQEQRVSGVPDIYHAGQGGLMDVVVDKDFLDNHKIYLSLSHGQRSGNGTRLVSAVLKNSKLAGIKVLFTALPLKKTGAHYGGRIAQMKDGSLLMSIGDGFDYREQAQKLDSYLGKIIRVDQNGNAPSDNPWQGVAGALPELWSIGHRNEQALLVTPNGVIYEHEHGPEGGDEINQIEPGNNYGWPVITYGIDYDGASITPYTEYPGMQQPLVDWTPSIAPSGMTYYTGAQFPQWQGDLFAVSLKQGSVRRIDLVEGKPVSDTRVFPELSQRLRDIRTGPDGALYILTDGKDGKLLRISNN